MGFMCSVGLRLRHDCRVWNRSTEPLSFNLDAEASRVKCIDTAGDRPPGRREVGGRARRSRVGRAGRGESGPGWSGGRRALEGNQRL